MKRNNKTMNRVGLAMAVVLAAGAALSQASPATDTIQARQKGFKAMGSAFKSVRDQMQGGSPDPEVIKKASVDIKAVADQISDWFPAGSGPEAGVKTAAKPEIWSNASDFDAARKNFIDQAGTFNTQAATGKVDGSTVQALGKACGGCHEKFRVKQD